jgi:hypothetical protein
MRDGRADGGRDIAVRRLAVPVKEVGKRKEIRLCCGVGHGADVLR